MTKVVGMGYVVGVVGVGGVSGTIGLDVVLMGYVGIAMDEVVVASIGVIGVVGEGTSEVEKVEELGMGIGSVVDGTGATGVVYDGISGA